MTPRWLATIALAVTLLTAKVLAQTPDQQSLLNKDTFEVTDIEALVRLNISSSDRLSLPSGLRFPNPIDDLLTDSSERVLVAMMLENYQALLAESHRRHWFIELARVYLSKFVTPEVQAEWMVKLNTYFEVSAAMEVFARRQLRILKPSDIEALAANESFSSVPDNMVEIHLLSARAALDQGDKRAFLEHLEKLKKASQGEAVVPLKIAYHCLGWQVQGDDDSLLAASSEVLKLGRAYQPGRSPSADIFWISAGNELVDLCRALLVRRGSSASAPAMDRTLGELASLADQWHAATAAHSVKAFDITKDVLWEKLESRQAQIAILLSCEKMKLLLVEHGANPGNLGEVLEKRRALLKTAYWADVPTRMYPVKGEFWEGSALERLQLRLEFNRWSADPDPSRITELSQRFLAVSPQDEALELCLDFSRALRDTGHLNQARSVLQEAESLAQRYHYLNYRLEILDHLRQLAHQQGDLEAVLEAARKGVRLARESVHQALPLRDGRGAGELARVFAAELAAQSLSVGNAEAALHELEEGRMIQSAHRISESAASSVGPRAEVVRRLRSAKSEEVVESRREALGELTEAKTVAQSKAEFLVRSREIQSTFPELYDRVLTIKPVEFPRLQRHLPNRVVLLQYFPTDAGLFIFAISRESLLIKRVPVTKDQLDKELLGYLRGIRRLAPLKRLQKRSVSLYKHLVAPFEGELEGCRTLILVPSGRLNYLPFAALTDERSTPLGSRFRMASLSKSSDLLAVLLKPSSPGESLVVVADPSGDLPAAREEGRALGTLFPDSQVLYHEKATHQALQAALGGTTYLHLATHGQIDPSDPAKSYLELAQGERLAGDDIFGLPLDETQLVTLSACNTALGRSQPTASVLSLAENFWVTGPASVVASLWAVDDTSTSLLMQEFYSGLKAGRTKGEALRAAQAKVRNTEGFEHPYFWSGFVLMGDWR